DRPCLELSGVYLAAGAYSPCPHPTDGRTDCTSADPSAPGPAQEQDTNTSCGDYRRERKRGSLSAESCLRCPLLFSRTTKNGIMEKLFSRKNEFSLDDRTLWCL